VADRPIFLTGFMGSGKSSVGVQLAAALGVPYLDLDEEIVKTTGCSINQLFASQGEARFREYEHQQLQACTPTAKAVIATGGGVVINPENRRFMRSHGLVVNLQVSLEQVLDRLKHANDRPLLAGDEGGARAAALMQERESWYADADIRIDTSGKSVEDVVAEILCLISADDQARLR